MKVFVVNWTTADDVAAAQDDSDALGALEEPVFTDLFLNEFTPFDLAQVEAAVEDYLSEAYAEGDQPFKGAEWRKVPELTVHLYGRSTKYSLESAAEAYAWICVVEVDR